ncbi:MAG: Bax inhibitor-1/YccA family protein [Bacteroidetes bacterium]|nr:MAG: Bax inhibitor-1/YccA family protein [Bacteroidota bacterium]
MAIFNSSNPMLKESTYEGTIFQGLSTGQEMTLKGTVNKFGFLFVLMLCSTIFSWGQFYKGVNPMPFMMIGVFGGLVLAVVMGFKKQWAPYIAPAYALLEGLFVGSVSAYYDAAYKTSYPGLVAQAVALTLLVAFVMFLLYRYRIIKVTNKFKTVMVVAVSCLMLFYLAKWIYFAITGSSFATFTNASTPLGIGFSVVVVCLAALFLLIDFDMIEKGIEHKLPKYMEWFSAVGLLITLVWLYFELLRLLSKLTSR